MKSMEEIYGELNNLIRESRWAEIEPFLQACMNEAKEKEENGIYVAAGNELLSFYRQSGQYEKAFSVSEDILLLMEELNLEDSEHFALVLMSTGAACEGAERPAEAESYYARAASILERKKDAEGILAEALARQGLLLLSGQDGKKAEDILQRAVELFEKRKREKERTPETGERSPESGEDAADAQAEIYYLTALAGLGEAAWKREDPAGALACYEKAARESFALSGATEGTKIFWKNCAAACSALKDPEKEACYRKLMNGTAQGDDGPSANAQDGTGGNDS